MQEVFKLDKERFGGGPLTFGWGKKGSVLAVVGKKRLVVLFNRDGREINSFALEGTAIQSTANQNNYTNAVNSMKWDPHGACFLSFSMKGLDGCPHAAEVPPRRALAEIVKCVRFI